MNPNHDPGLYVERTQAIRDGKTWAMGERWEPGEPLYLHPDRRRGHHSQYVRRLFDVLDDSADYDVLSAWGEITCEPCQVTWTFEQGPACWSCGIVSPAYAEAMDRRERRRAERERAGLGERVDNARLEARRIREMLDAHEARDRTPDQAAQMRDQAARLRGYGTPLAYYYDEAADAHMSGLDAGQAILRGGPRDGEIVAVPHPAAREFVVPVAPFPLVLGDEIEPTLTIRTVRYERDRRDPRIFRYVG